VLDYFVRSGVVLSEALQSIRKSDRKHSSVVQHSYGQGLTRSEAVEEALACQRCSNLKGRLHPCWDYLKAWRSLEAPRTRVPISRNLYAALITTAISIACSNQSWSAVLWFGA